MLEKLKDMVSPTNLTTDFECRGCGHEFSTEVSPGETTTCPECGSADVLNLELEA
ncbi:MAG: zinc ribbon domain-containing protein [Haloferacaceae archaeon]